MCVHVAHHFTIELLCCSVHPTCMCGSLCKDVYVFCKRSRGGIGVVFVLVALLSANSMCFTGRDLAQGVETSLRNSRFSLHVIQCAQML